METGVLSGGRDLHVSHTDTLPPPKPTSSSKRELIGVVVVHGIGEQRRFEHLDGQVRAIVEAMRSRRGTQVTVEILSGATAAFHAAQDTWRAGPTVRAFVDDALCGKHEIIEFHEVWWADINEPYSLIKQMRFWWWCLSVWLYPGKQKSMLPTASSVRSPIAPGPYRGLKALWVRARLIGIGAVAVVGATSVGMVTFLAERLLNLRTPDVIRVFVNYIAGVKLYNQKHRLGIGFPPQRQDLLDTLNEPPRVSVRRRMIRTLMDMAERPYERWYVLAHSLGSVVAFNGLMETAYVWPGYFTSERWAFLSHQPPVPPQYPLVSPAQPLWSSPLNTQGDTQPRRPVWADARAVAYRSRIFYKFHGLLTFGSPLEKFAAIWPARVPISEEPAFRSGSTWINVYDPVDPVSGVLLAFDGSKPQCCPKPLNVGYAAGPLLLLNHLKYLSGPYGRKTLADGGRNG